jgi:hypothetical protein
MKRSILSIAIVVLLLSSCKKETVTTETTTIEADGTTTTTTTTSTDYDIRLRKAEDDYHNAEENVRVARERGDTKAEAAAREVADDAKDAWEKLKSGVKEGAQDTKEALDRAGDTAKVKYNEALEKAKAK